VKSLAQKLRRQPFNVLEDTPKPQGPTGERFDWLRQGQLLSVAPGDSPGRCGVAQRDAPHTGSKWQ